MNRELRRLQKKAGGDAPRPPARPPTARGGARGGGGPGRRPRRKPLTFLREVIAELKKVAWPTRKEVVTYTVVVLVSVIFFMAMIGAMDFVSSKAVLELIRRAGR